MSVPSSVPVAIHGWSISSYLLAALNVLLGTGAVGALGIWLKTRPNMREAISKDRAADFDRLRQEIVDARAQAKAQADELHDELKAVKAEAKSARDAVNRLEAMLACVRPAVSILVAEVRRLDPGNEANAAVVQAQDLMAAASVGDFGIMRQIDKISATPPRDKPE